MTTSILLQNTIFIISTIVIILTILMSIIIEKEYKKLLISFDFNSKYLIIFINHIFYRDKFKSFKYIYFFYIS